MIQLLDKLRLMIWKIFLQREELGPNFEYLSICVNRFLDSIPGSVAFF